MRKLMTRICASAITGIPADKNLGIITIAAGKRYTKKLNLRAEGRLLRLYVKQKTGTAVAYSVQVLLAGAAYVADAVENYNAAPAANPGLLRCIPIQTVTTPGAELELTSDVGFGGINLEAGQSVMDGYWYLTIIPANSPDSSTWEAAITVESEV